jgi:hypothetical protein
MRRSLVVVSFLSVVCLPIVARAAPQPELELQTHWGDLDSFVLVGPAAEAIALDAAPLATDLQVAGARARATDVTQVLRYQPLELRVVERPPYEPGIRMKDNIANAAIAVGGVALITSVIVGFLR